MSSPRTRSRRLAGALSRQIGADGPEVAKGSLRRPRLLGGIAFSGLFALSLLSAGLLNVVVQQRRTILADRAAFAFVARRAAPVRPSFEIGVLRRDPGVARSI